MSFNDELSMDQHAIISAWNDADAGGSEALLLACAASYQWDTIVSMCAEQRRRWLNNNNNDDDDDETDDRPVAAPPSTRAPFVTDRWGNTALHTACYHSPPSDAVRALAYATPAHRAAAATTSADGSTPLLIACSLGGCAPDVLWMLLDAPADDSPSIAWRGAAGDAAGSTASTLTPLGELERRRREKQGDADPRSLQRDDDDDDSSTRALRDFWVRARFVLMRATASSRAEWRKWSRDIMRPTWSGLDDPKDYADLFGPQHEEDTVATRTFRPLHACLETPHCPVSLIEFVVTAFPEAVDERNEDGLTPLHVALSGSRDPFGFRDAAATTLLRFRPDCASRIDPDGRTPLCRAVVVGGHCVRRWWGEEDENRRDDGERRASLPERLYRASPRALWTRSPEDGLYPFASAAVVANPCVNTIYALLRECPQLVAHAIPT